MDIGRPHDSQRRALLGLLGVSATGMASPESEFVKNTGSTMEGLESWVSGALNHYYDSVRHKAQGCPVGRRKHNTGSEG